MRNSKKANILGIETSADETSAAVVLSLSLRARAKQSRDIIKSNIVYSQIAQHRKTGGIVPEVAARAHLPKIIPTIKEALAEARVQLKDIDAIAVTAGPGLITSLRIGVDTAKALAFALGKPIIPINHLEGHLLSALPTSYKLTPNSFPILGLIVSGGHTMLVLIKSIGRYKIIGETLDDAAGEAFDKTAKLLGLPYPGGPELSRLAEKGNPNKYDFPRALLNQKNHNFSFSGLKTAVLYFLRDLDVIVIRPPRRTEKQSRGNTRLPRPEYRPRNDSSLKADVAASVEQAIVDILVAKTLRAAADFKVKTVLLGGGVAANKKLRATLKRALHDYTLYATPYTLTGDNAGMIAFAATHHYKYGHTTTFDKVNSDPNLELKSWR